MGENGSHRITPILLLLAALIVAGAILVVSHDRFSQSAATVVALAKLEIGKAPADFVFARTGQGAPSQWTVVADETANGDRVIEQSSTDRTDYPFPLALYNPIVANNVDVSVSFRPVAGRVDQAGGIAVRVVDADNYYVARANALEDNVRFYRVAKGSRQQIDGVNVMVAKNKGDTLGLKADGDRFSIAFHAKTLFTTPNRHFPHAAQNPARTQS